MAQSSGFFNALYRDGAYDRKYNANDYCDNLAVIISNGVLRSDADDLKVTASGMIISVAAGRAWIDGHYYHNDATYTFPAIIAPIGGTRYDRVMLRLDNSISGRSISLIYVQGTAAATPTKPEPTRTDSVYDLVLADIFIDTNATSVTIADTRSDADLCGWVYSVSGDSSFFKTLDDSFYTWFSSVKDTLSSVSLFKQYQQTITTEVETQTIAFDIPQWDAGTCILEVYVNGVLDIPTVDYTVSGSTLLFGSTLIAGTEITVNVYKSIDGTGIMTVAGEITELQNKVSKLEQVADYSYYCTGSSDNIALSQIAAAIYNGSYTAADVTEQASAFLESLGGNTWLAALPDDANITIDMYGTCGVSEAYSGSGTSVSPYKWFALGPDAADSKRLTFDFSHCQSIQISCAANTENVIIYGTDLDIRNLSLQATCTDAGCVITMFDSLYNYGRINIENVKATIEASGAATIGRNGTFANCEFNIASSSANACVFAPNTDNLIRVIGGSFRAYTAATASDIVSAIFYTAATATNGVISAYNVNCPTIAISSYKQKYLAATNAGKVYINGVISTLGTAGTYSEIVGQLKYSKQQ